jgi:hypothetical protein
MGHHFNFPPNRTVQTVPTSRENAITKEYYDFLVGEINRGTIFRAVCRIENKIFGSVSYHLISV